MSLARESFVERDMSVDRGLPGEALSLPPGRLAVGTTPRGVDIPTEEASRARNIAIDEITVDVWLHEHVGAADSADEQRQSRCGRLERNEAKCLVLRGQKEDVSRRELRRHIIGHARKVDAVANAERAGTLLVGRAMTSPHDQQLPLVSSGNRLHRVCQPLPLPIASDEHGQKVTLADPVLGANRSAFDRCRHKAGSIDAMRNHFYASVEVRKILMDLIADPSRDRHYTAYPGSSITPALS